jgi:hypothetical protein
MQSKVSLPLCNRDSSVIIGIGYGLDGQCSIPGNRFFSFLGPTQRPI